MSLKNLHIQTQEKIDSSRRVSPTWQRIASLFSFFCVSVLICLLIGRVVINVLGLELTDSWGWLKGVDVVLISFVLIDFIILWKVAGAKILKDKGFVFWSLAGILGLNIIWGRVISKELSSDMYDFWIGANYLIIILGYALYCISSSKGTGVINYINNINQSANKREGTRINFGNKRIEEFFVKYPMVNKISITRKIAGWVYKEGWKWSISVIIILVIGVIYNIYQIFFGDLSTDGGYVLYDLYLIKQGFLPLKDFVTKGLGFNYLFFPLTYIPGLGQSIFTYRFLNLLFSLVGLLYIYKICKIYNKKIFPIAILFYFFAPAYLHLYYGIIHPAYLMTFLAIIAIYYFLKSVYRKDLSSLLIAIVIFIMASLSRSSAIFYLFTSISFLIYMYIRNKGKYKYLKLFLEKVAVIAKCIIILAPVIFILMRYGYIKLDNYLNILINIINLKKNTIGSYSGWDILLLRELSFGQIYLFLPLIIFIIKFCLSVKNKFVRNFSLFYISGIVVISVLINLSIHSNTESDNILINEIINLYFHQFGYIFIFYIVLRAIEIILNISIKEKYMNYLVGLFSLFIIYKNINIISEVFIMFHIFIIISVLFIFTIYFVINNFKNWRYFKNVTVLEKYLLLLLCSFLIFFTYIYSSMTAVGFGEVSKILVIICGIVIFNSVKDFNLNKRSVLALVILSFLLIYPNYKSINVSFRDKSILLPISYYTEAVSWLKDNYKEKEIFSNYPIYAFGLGINSSFNISRPQTYQNYPQQHYIRTKYGFPEEDEIIQYLKDNPQIWFIDEPWGKRYLRKYLKNLDKFLGENYHEVKDIGDGYIKIYEQNPSSVPENT